jgi:Uma2 family endonuclease
MTWNDVLADAQLRDLPYKIELNELGQIVMSPASNLHGYLQVQLATRLMQQEAEEGIVAIESSIETKKGVKVADVVWASLAFMSVHASQTPFENAPELCIEVKSPSNPMREMRSKIALYLQQGAREVWICNLAGEIRFFNAGGEQTQSEMFPNFPNLIPVFPFIR